MKFMINYIGWWNLKCKIWNEILFMSRIMRMFIPVIDQTTEHIRRVSSGISQFCQRQAQITHLNAMFLFDACVTRQALIFIFHCIWQPMFIIGKTRVSFWQHESENICSVSHVWKMSMRLIISKLIMKIGKNLFFLSLPLWFVSLINAIFKCFSLIEPLHHTSLFMFGTFFPSLNSFKVFNANFY